MNRFYRKFFLIILGITFLLVPAFARAAKLPSPNLVEVRIDDKFTDKKEVKIFQNQTLSLIGTADPESQVYLYFYSNEPLVASTNVDKNGNWQYVLNQTLSAGTHRIDAETHKNKEISAKIEVLNFTVKQSGAEISNTLLYMTLALLVDFLVIMLILKRVNKATKK